MSIYIWSTTEIVELTEAYGIDTYLPGMITVGSNAGLRCFCLDYRDANHPPVFCSVPWEDMDFSTVRIMANSLTEFLIAVWEGRITNEQIENASGVPQSTEG